MKRRDFLVGAATILGASAAGSLLALARPGMGHGNMGSGNMMGHGMGGEHSMANMISPGYQLGNRVLTQADIIKLQNADNHLLSYSALPKGGTLPQLPKLINVSGKEGFFKATLTAEPTEVELIKGSPTDFWAYNGSIPGPMIEVYEGDEVEITLVNRLPQSTTIHWHGLLVPPEQDGNPQDEVKPGQKHTYRFKIPDNTAGTYWYHPHGHNTVAEQAYRGLAGVFIVKSKKDPYKQYQQMNWLFSDLKLNQNGRIADNSFNDWMNGREGQFILMNGSLRPNVHLEQPSRVRVWNACSGKYLKLGLEKADIYLIATDGGFIENPQRIDSLLLTPGERAELLIIPKDSGEAKLQSLAYDRGKMGMVPADKTMTLATVKLAKSAVTTLPKNVIKLPHYGTAHRKRLIEYREVMNRNQMLFLINNKLHDMSHNEFTVKSGEVEEWVIYNNSHMDHNFHIHGTQFLVMSHEYRGEQYSPEIKGFKDTINVRPYEKVTLRFVQYDRGIRMFHCHILEHETLGMMGQILVS